MHFPFSMKKGQKFSFNIFFAFVNFSHYFYYKLQYNKIGKVYILFCLFVKLDKSKTCGKWKKIPWIQEFCGRNTAYWKRPSGDTKRAPWWDRSTYLWSGPVITGYSLEASWKKHFEMVKPSLDMPACNVNTVSQPTQHPQTRRPEVQAEFRFKAKDKSPLHRLSQDKCIARIYRGATGLQRAYLARRYGFATRGPKLTCKLSTGFLSCQVGAGIMRSGTLVAAHNPLIMMYIRLSQ
jgi:hypothetical protein